MARKLILCSDGTGNSGAKARGTNVWRFYQALIKDPDHQISFYQDGVGTHDIKFLRLLGGACGLGLNANLREMYRFLVHNYQDGDEIYLLGFSRGAFTVRALVYLLAWSGIIRPDGNDPEVTERRIDTVFKHYHWSRAESRKYGKEVDLGVLARKGPLTLGTLLNSYPHLGRLPLEEVVERVHSSKINTPVLPLEAEEYLSPPPRGVKFVGVWDTVDAVGLPIDELTEALDWLFKFRFYNFDRVPLAEFNYHALSLDDERHTFHPVMWDEKQKAEDLQVEQVWFPGVHSNVGGGYPKDDMAYVSLDWMMQKAGGLAGGHGLLFQPALRCEAAAGANPEGKIYDSRTGFAAYYRYKPRDVRAICKEAHSPVKLHRSVFQRIDRYAEDYAPVNVPRCYAIEPGGGPHSSDHHKNLRLAAQKVADQVIWWRRGLYFLFLATTLGSLLAVHRYAAMPLPQSEGWAGAVERFPAFLGEYLPAFLQRALGAFNGRGELLLLFALIYGGLLCGRCYLRKRTRYLGKLGWNLAAGKATLLPTQTPLEALAVAVQRCRPPKRIRDFIRERLFPVTVFATVVLILAFWLFNALLLPPQQPLCESQAVEAKRLDGKGENWVFPDFHTCNPWYATGIVLEKGATYAINVRETSIWRDGTIPAGPDGLQETPNIFQKLMAFTRRDRQEGGESRGGWFQLMADIGGKQQLTVGSGKKITPDHSGPLHFFVNDSQCDLCLQGVFAYYRNNQGTAEITVTRVAEPRPIGQ